MAQKVVTFSPEQREALVHRLELYDCFGEILVFTLPGVADDIIEAAARGLYQALSSDPQILLNSDNEIEKEVLVEAIEGSTWVAAVSDDAPKRAGAIRTLENAAKKIEEAYGLREGYIEVPKS